MRHTPAEWHGVIPARECDPDHPTDRIARAVAEQVAAECRVDVSRVDVDEIRRDVAEYRDLDRPQDAAMIERLTQLLAVLRFRDGGYRD